MYICTISNEFKKRLLFSLQIVPLGTLINELVICDNNVITRDDAVSQRLKFGSTFLSSSWESKIALFF